MPPTRKRRTRSKAPSTDEIVAPGGGTQKDVNHLASNLGLESSAVAALLNCQGEGVAAVRASTRNSSNQGEKEDKPVLSAAWSDFMSEEGYSASSTTNTPTAQDTHKGDDESEAKRAKTDTNTVAQDVTTPPPSSEDAESWEYQLPIRPLMRPPSHAKSSLIVYPTPGLLAQTGTLDSVMVGRTKRPLTEPQDLQEPTLLTPSVFDAKIALVATAPSAAHSICILESGDAYSWGRNEMGQCGLGSTSACVPLPTKIELEGTFVGAAVGKSHSILIEESGVAYAVGSNKCGQCGVNSSAEMVGNWKKCVLDGVGVGDDGEKELVQMVQASCGENFTVVLDSEGRMYTAGLSEFGQLGNGETGEYFITASKLAFANSTKLERRSTFCNGPSGGGDDAKKDVSILPDSAQIRIASISCGKNHTIAVEAPSKSKNGEGRGPPARVFTWGSGAYGCLGHGQQVDEYTPRLISTLQGPLFSSNAPLQAAAGSQCSMVRTQNGHVYYWGKHRSVGEAQMRPSLLDVLANNQHVVQSLSGGFQTVFCGTKNGVTISWGQGATGELGYGASNAKSSSKPKFVEKLDSCLVSQISCGYGHTLFIISDEDEEDKKAWGKMAKIESDDLSTFVKGMTSS